MEGVNWDDQYPESDDLRPVMLDPATTTQFSACNTTYYVERNGGLSIIRERWLEKFRLYSLYGRQPAEIITQLKDAYTAINGAKIGDAAVKIDNLLKGMIDMEQKAGPLYYACTLFINRHGENRKEFSIADADAKIKDWQDEGIDSRFFLSAGLAWLITTSENWLSLTQSYSSLGITEREQGGTLPTEVEPES